MGEVLRAWISFLGEALKNKLIALELDFLIPDLTQGWVGNWQRHALYFSLPKQRGWEKNSVSRRCVAEPMKLFDEGSSVQYSLNAKQKASY